MTDKFKDTYRIPSARWRDWDYGADAAYFVTVCTAHREPFFGEISNGVMNLSETGKTVQAEWLKTPGLRPDMNILLDEYVVMPNHFHGIIMIGENRYNTDVGDGDSTVETRCLASPPYNRDNDNRNNNGRRDDSNSNAANTVETRCLASPPYNHNDDNRNNNGRSSGSNSNAANTVETRCLASPPYNHNDNNRNNNGHGSDSNAANAVETRCLASPPYNRNDNNRNNNGRDDDNRNNNGHDNDNRNNNGRRDVKTRCIASLQQNATQPQWQSNRFGSQSKNLASVMRGFKSAVTKFARTNRIPFAWQTRFHDRVIRNYDEHNRIAHYINGNIENWQDDEMYV